MNILMILDREYPPDVRVENEIEALSSEGHTIHLACYTRKARPSHEIQGQLNIHRKPISSFIYKSSVAALKAPCYFRFWYKFLNEIANTVQFDAVHVHDLPLAAVGAKIAKKKNAKLTLDFHEHWPSLLEVSTHTQSILGKILSSKKQWLAYEKKVCLIADHIIVISEEFKNRLIGFGIPSQKIVVVSNTINTNSLSGIKLKAKSPHFELFYGGGINKHRGLETIILAIPYITAAIPDFKFVIAGAGTYSSALKKMCSELNIAQYVEFTGHLEFKVMMERLSTSWLAAIPFHKNNHTDIAVPHKIFQYLSFGVPVIASNCSTITRILNELNTGIIYQWDSESDFSRKIIEFNQNRSYHDASAKSVLDRINNEFSWEIDSARLKSIYQ